MLMSKPHLTSSSSNKEVSAIGADRGNHQPRNKKLHSIPLLKTSLCLLGTLTLLVIVLQPFFAIKTRECSRLAFSLTIYRLAEASTEYDGQCTQKP